MQRRVFSPSSSDASLAVYPLLHRPAHSVLPKTSHFPRWTNLQPTRVSLFTSRCPHLTCEALEIRVMRMMGCCTYKRTTSKVRPLVSHGHHGARFSPSLREAAEVLACCFTRLTRLSIPQLLSCRQTSRPKKSKKSDSFITAPSTLGVFLRL